MLEATVTPATYGRDAAWAKVSLEHYQHMIETGTLTAEDKVELLENYVVLKMPRNPRHDSVVQQLLRPIMRYLPEAWDLRIQCAITLADSQPEPDMAIVRGRASNYQTHHPGPSEIGLVIEAADSSLLRDQRDKTRLYARAALPWYWILNLVEGQLEVYSQPSGPTDTPSYGLCEHYRPGQTVPLTLDGQAVAHIPVAELLP